MTAWFSPITSLLQTLNKQISCMSLNLLDSTISNSLLFLTSKRGKTGQPETRTAIHPVSSFDSECCLLLMSYVWWIAHNNKYAHKECLLFKGQQIKAWFMMLVVVRNRLRVSFGVVHKDKPFNEAVCASQAQHRSKYAWIIHTQDL